MWGCFVNCLTLIEKWAAKCLSAFLQNYYLFWQWSKLWIKGILIKLSIFSFVKKNNGPVYSVTNKMWNFVYFQWKIGEGRASHVLEEDWRQRSNGGDDCKIHGLHYRNSNTWCELVCSSSVLCRLPGYVKEPCLE